jgi:2-methylaconitate cis-trans-isomerase PrpF
MLNRLSPPALGIAVSSSTSRTITFRSNSCQFRSLALKQAYKALGNYRLYSQSQKQHSLPAAYYRGGTSRAVFFRHDDLPKDRNKWNSIFLGCIGSPDPYGRQLDGLGGGISSLSKVCVVGKSVCPDADVDYTFVSLGIKDTNVDFSSNCGNMSAAVGPYALDSGLIPLQVGAKEAVVRIHNTNTGKIIESSFPVADDEASVYGDFTIDGVAGAASRVQLKFLNPAGSRTGKLFPTNAVTDTIDDLTITCIDAGNPCCFVLAEELDIPGTITPQQIEDYPNLVAKLDIIRRKAGVKMGLAESEDEIPGSVPKIAIVSKPRDEVANNVVIRAMSVGQPHKAIPVTVALASAAAANVSGTTIANCLKGGFASGPEITIHHASGTLAVAAEFGSSGALVSGTVFRTARRLMEGKVYWR